MDDDDSLVTVYDMVGSQMPNFKLRNQNPSTLAAAVGKFILFFEKPQIIIQGYEKVPAEAV